MGMASLTGLRANMNRIRGSTTTAARYNAAVSRFQERSEPPETLLAWVCRDDEGYLDFEHERLVLKSA